MSAPTLFVGLGGQGLKIIKKIASRALAEGTPNVEFVAMDTDVNELRSVHDEHPNVRTVQTSTRGTVGSALDRNEFARERWFPLTPGIMGKTFTEGAGQVRAVSRLALDQAIEANKLTAFSDAVEHLKSLSGDTLTQEMRVVICGSLCGGTGSGLILPVGMFIRNYLLTKYQDSSAIIRGFFLEPETLYTVIASEDERNSLRANAYATIREIDAFFRKQYAGDSKEYESVVFNAPQPGLGTRVDYPNILPYDYVFLMDGISASNQHLLSLSDYISHAADTIFAMTLGPTAARSNSSEDNLARMIASTHGRSRYSGAGCSHLIYPAQDVQRYIGYRWASESLSRQWLEIDESYKKRVREEGDEVGPISSHYIAEFDGKRLTDPFYRKAARGTTVKQQSYDEAGAVLEGQFDEEPCAEVCVEAMIEHASAWVYSDSSDSLRSSCGEYKRCVDSESFKPVDASDTSLRDRCSRSDGASGQIAREYQQLIDVERNFFRVINDSVSANAKAFARRSFSVSEFDENPLATRNAEWQVEHYVSGGKPNEAVHPSGARYILYSISRRLGEEIEDYDQECQSQRDALAARLRDDYDFYGEDDAIQDVGDAVRRHFSAGAHAEGGMAGLMSKLGKQGVGEEAFGEVATQGQKLNEILTKLKKYCENVAIAAFLKGAKKYVDDLSVAYEGFYKNFAEQIDNLAEQIKGIEQDAAFNSQGGSTSTYVCASKECLEQIADECPLRGDGGELDPALCAEIYRSLLRAASSQTDQIRNRRAYNERMRRVYSGLFKRTIVDFWFDKVLDNTYGYPEIVDKSLAKAILDEARYLYPENVVDAPGADSFLNNYVKSKIEGALQLATPFIEVPVGENPREIKACAFSEDAMAGAGAQRPYFSEVLDALSPKVMDSGTYPANEIVFYRSVYGFSASDLPKYAPARDGNQPIFEGEYHRAYWSLVQTLSPDSRRNSHITPHIDRNWHLTSCLPDIHDEYQRQINSQITRAFIYGLVYQEFGVEMTQGGRDIFYLSTARNGRREDLIVSNGTYCDQFYEVYDALKINPPVITELVRRSEASRAGEEKVRGVEESELVRRVGSRAFSTTVDLAATATEVGERLAQMAAEGGADSASTRDSRTKLTRELVTSMFATEGKQRSLLEIPLYYSISLPHVEARPGEVEEMVDAIFENTRDYFASFCSAENLPVAFGRFFTEQLAVFELNLPIVDARSPYAHANPAVGVIREKALSYLDESDRERSEELKAFRNRIITAWGEFDDKTRR